MTWALSFLYHVYCTFYTHILKVSQHVILSDHCQAVRLAQEMTALSTPNVSH